MIDGVSFKYVSFNELYVLELVVIEELDVCSESVHWVEWISIGDMVVLKGDVVYIYNSSY